jgi:putative FmdB family regulatory protein
MPTYEYICAKCGHEFEQLQSIADKPLTVCPEALCARKKWGRGRVKRKISAGGGLLFKGSGFYITDYRSEKYKEAAKKDSGAAKSSGAESKVSIPAGDSKSAAKTQSKPAGTPAKN